MVQKLEEKKYLVKILLHNRFGPVSMQKGPSIYYVSKGMGGWVYKIAKYYIYADLTPFK
jgi:hypothetical protein